MNRNDSDELRFRFELLQSEYAELQQAIRKQDDIALRVQGWAVTTGLAASGLALTAHVPSAALLGMLSSVAFWVIDAGRRATQSRFVERVVQIEQVLESHTIAEALSGGTGLVVPHIATHMSSIPVGGRWLPIVGPQLVRPTVWALYGALLVTLGVVFVATALGAK